MVTRRLLDKPRCCRVSSQTSYAYNMSTSHRCFVTFFIGCQSLQGYSSRLLLWPSTVSESESSLPQASNLTGFRIVTSVTPFGWSQRPVRFAGKHVHRPAKFLHRGSCRLERTPPDLRSPLNSRRQFRSKLKTHLFRQAYTAWFLWEQLFKNETL